MKGINISFEVCRRTNIRLKEPTLKDELTSTDLVSYTGYRNRIVIVNSKLLKRHLKAKRRAPAYSRQIRGVFQRIVRGRLRSFFQRVRECVKSEVFSKE